MDEIEEHLHRESGKGTASKVIHAYASMPHYKRHVQAIFKHLHPSIRGNIFGPEVKAKDLPDGVFLVGSYVDAQLLAKRKVIYVEHGAGQSYKGDARSIGSPYYHGSKHPKNIIGYVCPNEKVASSWDKPSIAVGCPALDIWHISLQELQTRSLKPAITFTFHWDCRVAQESRWAFPHYADQIELFTNRLRALGFDVFGHSHPRSERVLKRFWRSIGVEYLETPDRVFWASDILIADNTSLLMEFASLNRPVVFLNAPWYRKDIEHGGRFWQWNKMGINVDQPDELFDIDFDNYLFTDAYRNQREKIVPTVYTHTDGSAGFRAAKWVTQQVLTV